MSDLGLNIFRPDDTAELALVYEENDEPMGITLTLAGPDSAAYRKAEIKNSNDRIRRLQKGKRLSAEITEQWHTNLLAAATLDWKFYPPAVAEGGQGPEFSPANCRQLYQDYPEVADQVSEFIGQRRNFRGQAD